jgi:hypothetical protein
MFDRELALADLKNIIWALEQIHVQRGECDGSEIS